MLRFQVFVRVIHQTKVCVDACIRHSHDECDAGIRIIISPYSMEDHVQIFINVGQVYCCSCKLIIECWCYDQFGCLSDGVSTVYLVCLKSSIKTRKFSL